MKVTKKQINVFCVNAETYLNSHLGIENKFVYALRKMLKRIRGVHELYLDEIQELRLDYASLDEKTKNLIIQDGQHVFTPEKQKEFLKKWKEKSEELIEIQPFFVDRDVWPKDLSYSLEVVFTDFVIEYKEIEV